MTTPLQVADLAGLRAAAREVPGPAATLAACLIDTGLVQLDPHDPHWVDRDRLLVASPRAEPAVRARLANTGHAETAAVALSPAAVLPVAVGLALASRLDGDVFRVWALLDPDTARAGGAWEGLQTAAAHRPLPLIALVVGTVRALGRLSGLAGLAGWRLLDAAADDPADVLGACQRAITAAGPTLIVAAGR